MEPGCNTVAGIQKSNPKQEKTAQSKNVQTMACVMEPGCNTVAGIRKSNPRQERTVRQKTVRITVFVTVPDGKMVEMVGEEGNRELL